MTISKQLYSNNAKTTLSSSISTVDTTIQVSDGSRFPNPAAGEFFLATIEAGSNIEVIKVEGRTGNTFTNCTRAFEGVAANFGAGSRIDNRVTATTLAAFARKIDRVDEVNSIELLASPIASNSNSYITHSNDDGGNPIVAFRNTDTAWRFNTHRHVQVNGLATSNTSTTSLTSTTIAGAVSGVLSGKYIIQFYTGVNAGLARLVTASTSTSVSWVTALPAACAIGDQFEIFKSDSSIINELLNSSDDGLIYSILLSE